LWMGRWRCSLFLSAPPRQCGGQGDSNLIL
jgi:hypothetical protein